MNEFEQLKNSWKEQSIQGPSEDDFSNLKSGIKKVAGKQKITNVILLATVSVIVAFFFYVGAIDFSHVALATGTMIGALVIRVLVEFFSIAYLKGMATTTSIQNFKERLRKYYQNRIWVHFLPE